MKLDVTNILWGMGILIGIYLIGRFGTQFDAHIGKLSGFVQEESSILQGNYPFRVYDPLARR